MVSVRDEGWGTRSCGVPGGGERGRHGKRVRQRGRDEREREENMVSVRDKGEKEEDMVRG